MTRAAGHMLVLFIFLFCMSSAGGQSTGGFINERFDRIDAAIDAEIRQGRIAGAVVMMSQVRPTSSTINQRIKVLAYQALE